MIARGTAALTLIFAAGALAGCGSLSSSVGSNLSSGGRSPGDAGCGAVNVSVGGAGNGGLCLTPPGMIGTSTVNPNGSVSITVTGWAFNPTVPGQQPTGSTVPSTPANAGSAALSATGK